MAVHDATSPRHHIWIFNTYSLYCDPHSPFKLRAIMCMHWNRRQVTLTSWSLSTHQSHLIITATEITGNSTVCSTVCLSSRLYVTGPLWQVTDGFPSQRATIPVHLHILLLCHFTKQGMSSLLWRHNEHDGVSNHQPHECLLSLPSRRRSKKTSKLRVTGLCAGNSPETGEFPARMASNAENVSIWWRHHVNACLVGIPNAKNARFFPKANVDSFVESLNW